MNDTGAVALATAMSRTWRSFGLAAGIALSVATAYGSNVTVDVGANATLSYLPATPLIAPGDTVHWVWGSGTHSVTSGNCVGSLCTSDSRFDSGIHGTPFTFDVLFTGAVRGRQPYFCAVHGAAMRGTIVVKTTPEDFNGDGSSDILWQNTSSGNVALWFMSASGTVQSSVGLGNAAGWTPMVGDFNGDGIADILWQHSSGTVGLWLMNGNGTVQSTVGLGTVAGWTPTVGDFNGDGIADILWQNTSSGNAALWFMNTSGMVQSSVGLGNLSGWTPSVGDFNGDGIADILWQNTSSGNAAVWLMNANGTVLSNSGLGNLAGWTPRIGDYNGDGKADILWQNAATGNVALWLMNGATVSQSLGLGN